MDEYQRRVEGELDFSVPREWPRDPAAAAALEQRARDLARLIAQVPLDAFSTGLAQRAVEGAVNGLEALWPVPATRPTAFGVPAPAHIDYYVTESVDQALGILGVEVPERFGAAGGFAKPVNGQVFSGIPQLGENYRHELAHLVLLPILRGAETSLLASEGVPTWLGGTAGRDFVASVRYLDSVMQTQPRLTLNAIVDSAGVASEIRNAAGGVLAQMVNESGGAQAVREFLRAGARPAAIRAALERLLQRPWATIVADWRRTVDRLAAT